MSKSLYRAKPTNTSVSYRLMGAQDQLIRDLPSSDCFSAVTYSSIEKDVESVAVYRGLGSIPYDWETIVRWTAEISALGFPTTLTRIKDKVEWSVSLKDHLFKHHLASTLSLIRCLFERGICHVPDDYLTALTDDMSLDQRFDLLQTAHRTVKVPNGSYPGNTNHMVTYAGNGSTNVRRADLFAKIKAANLDVRASNSGRWGGVGYVAVDSLWRG